MGAVSLELHRGSASAPTVYNGVPSVFDGAATVFKGAPTAFEAPTVFYGAPRSSRVRQQQRCHGLVQNWRMPSCRIDSRPRERILPRDPSSTAPDDRKWSRNGSTLKCNIPALVGRTQERSWHDRTDTCSRTCSSRRSVAVMTIRRYGKSINLSGIINHCGLGSNRWLRNRLRSK